METKSLVSLPWIRGSSPALWKDRNSSACPKGGLRRESHSCPPLAPLCMKPGKFNDFSPSPGRDCLERPLCCHSAKERDIGYQLSETNQGITRLTSVESAFRWTEPVSSTEWRSPWNLRLQPAFARRHAEHPPCSTCRYSTRDGLGESNWLCSRRPMQQGAWRAGTWFIVCAAQLLSWRLKSVLWGLIFIFI